MTRLLFIALIVLCYLPGGNAGEHKNKGDEEPPVVNVVEINKQQLAALDVALREMSTSGESFKGRQGVIEGRGKYFRVGFMDDPIDMRVAGSQNGITWEIRKSDLKVLRRILDR
jgi:hypothetical protein